MMEERSEASKNDYPRGRGYGHDYMRGGEVLGGYGYSSREEYAKPRGELQQEERHSDETPQADGAGVAEDGSP
jgi:hypothetical protein